MSSEIVPGLYQLPGVQWVGAYLWRPRFGETRPGSPMLLDCGWPWSGQGLTASLVALGCYPEEIETIVITHDDVDHAGRLAPLAAVSGATVVAHTVEAQRLSSDHWRKPPILTGLAFPAVTLLDRLYQNWRHTPVSVALPIEDGALLPGGWRAVHTPGHTPGHTSFFLEEQRLLVAGDALGHQGNGRFKFPMAIYTEDCVAASCSIRKLAELEPDVIVFGHGPALYRAAEPLKRFADQLPNLTAQ